LRDGHCGIQSHARGMLDETLVVWFGDFGRTPKVNPTAGRDHWATAGVALMAGGGLKVGQVVGRTNALAACSSRDLSRRASQR
jgi:uncharacterized protein (DUF1501 family)